MATKILNTLDSASEKLLKNANKQLKEEAGKQLMKYKAMIPSKENIKQRLVDEVVKQGKELACSVEGQKFIEDLKKKIEDGLEVAKDFLKKAKEKLQSIQEQIQKIRDFVDRMLGYLDIMEGLIITLSVAVRVAQVAIKFLKGLAADVDTGVKLNPLIVSINSILALITSYFGQYLNVCDLNNNGELDALINGLDGDVEAEYNAIDNANGTEYIDFLETEDGIKKGYRRYTQ